MKLVVGLGNPGRAYERTRHNVGWMVVDHLADVWSCDTWRRDGDALVTDARLGSTRVRLMKPTTYMNLSGSQLRPWMRREGWEAARDLLVIVDEVALPLGRFRLRAAGSAGGHNGLKSIEAALGSSNYARLRVGILPDETPRPTGPLADFVTSPFGKSERVRIDELLPTMADLTDVWVRDGVLAAMNTYNNQR